MLPTVSDHDVNLTVAQIGARAQASLAATATWSIAAVFEHSCHLWSRSSGIVCIGGPRIGNGPLNVVLAAEPLESWRDLGLASGAAVAGDGHQLRLTDGAILDLTHAVVWNHGTWPDLASTAQIGMALAHMRDLAMAKAPAEGLAAAVLQIEAARTPIAQALIRSATLSIATLRDWLDTGPEASADMDRAVETAVHRLIGLGAGLTPSGDDLLSGLLIALHATGDSARAERISHAITSAGPDATSDLSRAFLGCAMDGEPTEAMHALVSAIVAADITAIAPALDRVAETGHTSGWDMLAGALLRLEALAPAE